jgi:hypothetical protein
MTAATDQTTEREQRERAQLVAEIRALADFIEVSTDLPAPQSCQAQYSMWDKHGNYEDRCAEVRRVAEALDVDIADGGRTIRFPMGKDRYPRVHYVVNAAPESREERMATAAEVLAS